MQCLKADLISSGFDQGSAGGIRDRIVIVFSDFGKLVCDPVCDFKQEALSPELFFGRSLDCITPHSPPHAFLDHFQRAILEPAINRLPHLFLERIEIDLLKHRFINCQQPHALGIHSLSLQVGINARHGKKQA